MKEKKDFGASNILQWILGLMIIAAFVFFFIGEVVLPPENLEDIGEFGLYEGEWVQVFDDGTEEAIEVPGECKTEQGEWVTIETVLPEDISDISFAIRSMQQDFKIYVGDELRKEYSTIETQPFGKTSTITYVFFEVYKADGGETLRIEFMSDSSYAGYVSEVYMGDHVALWQNIIKNYAPSLIIAMFMLLVGISVSVLSIIVRFMYKTEVELLHMGNGIILASSWMIAESRMRQFIFPNSTMAVYLGFFMIMLLPYPIAAYMNKVQKCRYRIAYLAIYVAVAVNCVLATTLQVLQIKDFFETMMVSHIIIGMLIIIMTVTIILDIIRGYIKEYWAIAIGFVALMLGGIGEIIMVYINSSQYNGIPLCLGLVVFLIAAGMRTAKDVRAVNQERNLALAVSESKSQFLASMSHEIRTPINTIMGMNEMILRESKEENTREYADNIHRASEILLGLINDILDLSKIEAGKLQIVESDYSTANMLKAAISGIEMRAKRKNLEIKKDVDETLPAVLSGDEIRITQILNNLLSNAVKYTETGSVTLTAKGKREENGFFLQLAVSDTGMGIEKEDIERLFDTFVRLDLKKNQNIEGTGLGLSITKQLVENMGGSITVTSEVGKGSCFTVEIPQTIIDETAMGSLESKNTNELTEKEIPDQMFKAPDAKVLVVDDNKMNLKVIGNLLKRTEMQVDFANDGNQCLEMTKEKKYDIILMDHMMPEPDGVETLHLLRADQENKNLETPVIVLTANAVGDVEEQYLEEGFDGYLSKPIDVEKMEKTLSKYV